MRVVRDGRDVVADCAAERTGEFNFLMRAAALEDWTMLDQRKRAVEGALAGIRVV